MPAVAVLRSYPVFPESLLETHPAFDMDAHAGDELQCELITASAPTMTGIPHCTALPFRGPARGSTRAQCGNWTPVGAVAFHGVESEALCDLRVR